MVGARVLIVTAADGALAPELGFALSGAGHRPSVAAHGAEALVALACRPCDMVVIEVRDLRRQGHALAQIVRERPSFAELPLLAVVEDCSLRDHAGLLVAGFDRVVTAATAKLAVPRFADEVAGQPQRVPSLLEAYAQAAVIALRQPLGRLN